MFCECGCGRLTKVIARTDNRKGWIKGSYYRYIQGHSIMKPSPRYKGIDKLVEKHQGKHICKCGCGNFIEIKPYHFYKSRYIPIFILGHHSNTPEIKEKQRKYNSIHTGKLSPRWKVNRDEIRGRVRCKVDFTRRQKRDIYVHDEGICQNCKIICLLDVDIKHPYKVNIDHIISVENGGTNEISNGQVLCLSCHKLKHSAKAKTANSEKPNLERSSMATPNQAQEIGACVETNVQSPKGMI